MDIIKKTTTSQSIGDKTETSSSYTEFVVVNVPKFDENAVYENMRLDLVTATELRDLFNKALGTSTTAIVYEKNRRGATL